MTQIAQGAHVYLFPEPGQVYRVQADDVATVQVLYGAPSAVITLTAQSHTFGPYDSPAKLKVTANTAPAEYTLIRAHYAELTPEQIAGGAVGVLGSNNAGGVVEPDGDVPTLGGGSSVTVINDLTTGGTTSALSAEMGKSLQAGKMANSLPAMSAAFGAGTESDKAAFRSSVSGYAKNTIQRIGRTPLNLVGLGNSIFASPPNILDMLAGYSGGTLIQTTNAGIAGNTTAQMLARLASVSAAEPVVAIMECTNDSGGGVSVAAHVSNMTSILDTLISRGQLPVIILPPTRNTYTQQQNTLRLADYLLARSYGVPCYDPWTSSVDPATGGYKSGYDNADGVHPTFVTNGLAAQALWAQISGSTPASFALNRANVLQAGLWPTNCWFLTDSNSDGVPDGISTGGTFTPSLSAESAPSAGNYFQLTETGANKGGYAIGPSGAVSAGDRLVFCGYYAVSAIGPAGTGSQCSVALRWSNGVQKYAVNYQPAVSPLGFFYLVAVVPAGVNGVSWQVSYSTGSNNATVTMRVSNMQCYNMTAMGF